MRTNKSNSGLIAPNEVDDLDIESSRGVINSDPPTTPTTKGKFWIFHVCVILMFCGFSGGIGYACYDSQRAPQVASFQTQWLGTTSQLQTSTQHTFTQYFSVSKLVGLLVSFSAKRACGGGVPPFMNVPGFQNLSAQLFQSSGNIRSLSWLPLVDTTDPTLRPKWESWAKQNLASQFVGYAASNFLAVNTTAYKFGIYNKTSETTRKRAGSIIPGGDPRFARWLFPIWQVAPLSTNAGAMFLEPHQFVGTRFQTIEKLLAAGYGGGGAFTDIIQLIVDPTFRPSTALYVGVYSIAPTPILLGLTTLTLSFDQIFNEALPDNLQRIDVVVTSKTMTFTIAVDRGTVSVVGQGDFHESAMTSFGRTLSLNIKQDSPLSASDFTVIVYPSTAFYNQYISQLPVSLGIAVGILSFFICCGIYAMTMYVVRRQQRMREDEQLVRRSQEAAQRVNDRSKLAEAEKKREQYLKKELHEIIANSAHDMKSPTCALGLAVESLLDALDNNKPLSESVRHRVIETLHGMAHTIATVNMIINRSVDAAKSSTGKDLVSNKVPVDLDQLMDGVFDFIKWQSQDTGIEVIMEPIPDQVPEEILADEKWLKDDLLCIAGNAVKYSRARQNSPVEIRVNVIPPAPVAVLGGSTVSNTRGTGNGGIGTGTGISMLKFSFTDSGPSLQDGKLKTLFDRPEHLDRTMTGGMGLGLFCVCEHMLVLQGQYGAHRRTDGKEGTVIWFSIPLIATEIDRDQFLVEDDVERINPVTNRMVLKNTKKLTFDKHFSGPQNRTKLKGSQKDNSMRGSDQRSDHRSEHSSSSIQSKSENDLTQLFPSLTLTELDHPAMPTTPSLMLQFLPEERHLPRQGSIQGSGHNVSTRSIDLMKASPKEPKPTVATVLGTLPMLIVDDSVSILKMTKRAILNSHASMSFIEAKNGQEAFEQVVLSGDTFELIVTDIQMPICDGFEFTRMVRKLELEKSLSPKIIIGISANDQEKIATEAKESGMDGFMHKPFKLATLMEVIGDITNRRKKMLSIIGGTNVDVIPVAPTDTATDRHLHSENDGGVSPAAVAVAPNGATVITIAPPAKDAAPSLTQATVISMVTKGLEKGVEPASPKHAGSVKCSGSDIGIFAGKKILVVDDAISILKLMSHTLSNKAQAIVTQAKDGQEAVEECEKQVFDLILTDIQMPVLDGFGEARHIRAREKEHNLDRKIIVGISANGQDRIAVEAEEAGMDAFMEKPFKLDDLAMIYPKILECRERESSGMSLKTAGADATTTIVPRLIRPITTNAKIFVNSAASSGRSSPHMDKSSSSPSPSRSQKTSNVGTSSAAVPSSGSLNSLNRSDRLNVASSSSSSSQRRDNGQANQGDLSLHRISEHNVNTTVPPSLLSVVMSETNASASAPPPPPSAPPPPPPPPSTTTTTTSGQ